MSYILDALKRADSERERGTVPGIHAQPAPLAPASPGGERDTRRLLWLGAVVALLAVLILVLRWPWKDAPAPTAVPAPVTQSPVAVPAIQVPVVAAVAPPEVPSLPAATPAPVAAAPAVTTTLAVAPTAAARATRSAAAPAVAPASATAIIPPPGKLPTATAAVAPPPPEVRIPALAELPEDMRRQLPPLAISGSVYSDSPGQRMLIINGQIFRETEKPGPDVVLEQIRPKSAVFSFRGTRYSVAY